MIAHTRHALFDCAVASTGFNPRSLFLRERVLALSALSLSLSLSLLCLDESSITEITAFWYINTPLWKRAILLRESKCKEIWFILWKRDDHSKHPRERRECSREQHKKERFFSLSSVFCLLGPPRPKISERRAIFFLPALHKKNALHYQNFSRKLYI